MSDSAETVVQKGTGQAWPGLAPFLFFSLKKGAIEAVDARWRACRVDFWHLIVAIIAGGRVDAGRVESSSALSSVLRCYGRGYARPFTPWKKKPALRRRSYSLVVIPRTALKVKFERIKENSNDKEE